MICAVYIGTDRLELFEDENIVIKSSVAKIEDITKIYTDISKGFTVPCSDLNNTIFNHWYESNVINGFDARIKVPAVIELRGINFRTGKIRLNKVNFKNNQPDSYDLDFFGNLVELKDIIKDDKLTDLDLSDLDFDYTSDNVKQRLAVRGNLSFSLLTKKRLLYDSGGGVTESDTQTNIWYNGTSGTSGLKYTDVTGSVKQVKIIEAIETKYNLEFSHDFFYIYDFFNQYMALTGKNSKSASQAPLTNADTSADPTVSGDIMLATGFGTPSQRVTKNIVLEIEIPSFYSDIEYSFYIKNGSEIVARKDNVKGSQLGQNGVRVRPENVNGELENVTFWIESAEPIQYKAIFYRFIYNLPLVYIYNSGFITTTVNYDVSRRLPDIKISDYLKGIFKMSKLVAIVQKDDTIFVDSLVNYYRKGKVYDLTDYVDYDSHTISAGKILNQINYNFEEPQTILNQQFKKNNGVAYGDLELSIYDSNNNLIDGDSLDYKLPFEQIVYEKIFDISSNTIDVNLQYGLMLDENLETVDIKPHIHYLEPFTTYIKFVNDSQIGEPITEVNCPMHVLNQSLKVFSTVFGSEYNEFDGSLINNTLYSNYHQQYIENVFNVQTRFPIYKAKNVPTQILLNLNLNDVIEIKGKLYRIEDFETNTINADVTFKLRNALNLDLTPLFPITADSTVITADRTDITADSTSGAEVEPIIPS